MTFTGLPLELREQIAAYVEASHRPSLYAFNLTSKACHEASMLLIYREVHITARDREGLRRDVDSIFEAISREKCFRNVQRISIKGALKMNPKALENMNQKPWTPYWITYGLGELLEDEEPIFYNDRYVVYDEPVIERYSEEDMGWTPVIELVRAIPRLEDLIYDCRSQFPPSLLDALHGHHPQCRLHHLTFRFRTLLWGVPKPYELELVTSPSLHRVKATCSNRDTDGDDDFNHEAMMELVGGLAPNLKDITILALQPMLSPRYMRPRDVWKGLPGYNGKSKGSLTSLSLRGYSDLHSIELLENWASRTDLSCLQQLTLGGSYCLKSTGLTGETMQWASQFLELPQLRKLKVHLARDSLSRRRLLYTDPAVSFFQSLEPLEELSVAGSLDTRIVDAIISQHGRTLRKLCLRPVEQTYYRIENINYRGIPMEFTKHHVLQIQAECPVLEDLTIPVKRDKSSAAEREIYECFAKMENLKVLLLILDCSNWHVVHDDAYNPQFDEDDDKLVYPYNPYLKRGILKESFINSAVDEVLARSIWEVISKRKLGKRLQRLKLWTTGGEDYGTGSTSSMITDLLSNLSRSWLIERVAREDCEDIIVRELGQHEREARDEKTRQRRHTETAEVFEEVWPRKEDGKGWQDDWSSFPLQT